MAKTNDTDLSEILQDVGNGKIQLPDFQRPWTWECGRIKWLLASLSLGYSTGGDHVLGGTLKYEQGKLDMIKYTCRDLMNVYPENNLLLKTMTESE